MIKILFLIHDLGPGGAEKVLVNLVNSMDRDKFDITVMALFGGGVNEVFISKGIKYIAVYNKSISGNSHIMKLLSPEMLHKKYINNNYDIEVAFLEGPCTRIISGCREQSTKLVSWTHCTWQSKQEFVRSYRSLKEAKDCYQKFDQNIFVSYGAMEAFEKYCNLDKKTVIYNVNDSNKIKELANEPLLDDDFNHNEFNIVSVGKIEPVKGFDRLARIQKRLIDNNYKVHIYILGEGSQQTEIEKYCLENNIDDSFTFLGYQLNPYKYISNADLFVCSSWSEGLSTAVTEALILGVPVVATDVSGMRELLGNNEYGVISENSEEGLYNNIVRQIEDPELLNKLKLNSAKRGAMFSVEASVKKVQNLLNSVN